MIRFSPGKVGDCYSDNRTIHDGLIRSRQGDFHVGRIIKNIVSPLQSGPATHGTVIQ